MIGQRAANGFDFHCHLDLYPDPAAMIAACEEDGIVTLAVTTTPKAWPQNRKWTIKSSHVHAAVGLHPELVGERYGELPLLEECIKDSALVGEIGLDGSPQYRKHWDRQTEVFVRALTAAERVGGRVVSIHSRRAANEVVSCLEQHTTRARLLPVLHWFSGSIGAARKAAHLGCYFSINRRTLEHDAGIALVKSLPDDRLLTETDGPFTEIGTRKSEPLDALETGRQLAAIRGASWTEMQRVLAANAARVFAFAGISVFTD